MTKLLTSIAACLALAVVAVGCGSDDESTNTGAASTPAPAETGDGGGGAAAPEADAKGKGKEVVMKDITFEPGDVTIAAGETVTWRNDDSVGHDVHADDGSFSSGDPGGIQPGGDYAHAFDKAGTFAYVCEVHPGMDGKVVVK